MTLFPTTFRLAVDKTEALCVAYMDGRFDLEPELVNAAATCFAALHCAGGKNPNHPTERITPSEQWRANVQEIIKAMHRCLNVLFSTVDEGKHLLRQCLVHIWDKRLAKGIFVII